MIETTKCVWLVLTLLGGACAASGELASGFLRKDPEGQGSVVVDQETIANAAEDAGMSPEAAGGLGAGIASFLGLAATVLTERRKASRKRGEMWAAIESAKKPNGS